MASISLIVTVTRTPRLGELLSYISEQRPRFSELDSFNLGERSAPVEFFEH